MPQLIFQPTGPETRRVFAGYVARNVDLQRAQAVRHAEHMALRAQRAKARLLARAERESRA